MSTKQLRGVLLLVTVLLLASLLPLSVFADAPAADDPLLNPPKRELAVGGSERIDFTFPDAWGTLKKTEWAPGDPNVITVTNGTVRAVAAGKTVATMTLTLTDGSTIVIDYPYEVYRPVTTVRAEAAMTVGVGESSAPISVTVAPEDAKYQGVTFLSEDETIAKVDSKGVVTGVGTGNTTIKVISQEPVAGQGAPKSHSIRLTVVQKAQSITLSDEMIDVGKGKSLKLTATVAPENTTNPKLMWESSDAKIATVSGDGTIRGVALGTATITATATDGSGIAASCEVEVYPVVDSLKVEPKLAVQVGTSTEPLAVTVAPENAKYQGLIFESSDESIATVDALGVVTGVSLGKAKITVTSAEPSGTPKFAVVNVDVIQMVNELKLDQQKVEVARGERLELKPTIGPLDATNPKIVWKSSNPSIATVNNGIVSGSRVGSVIITAETTDGSNLSASCEVTVYQLVTQITTEHGTKIGVVIDRTGQIETEVKPDDARDKSLSWESDNPHIATVDQNGVVTGIRIGNTKIKAIANDGSEKELEFTLHVEPRIPMSAEGFTRIGNRGYYDQFEIMFKNHTMTRHIAYYEFIVLVNEGTITEQVMYAYTDEAITANSTRNVGRWNMAGLNYANNIEIKLQYVRYTDGTDEYFPEQPTIGRFT